MSLFPTTTTISSMADVIKTGTPYLALFTSSPNAGGGGTEVTGGSYARQAITFGSVTSGSFSNTAEIVFSGLPTATITHFAIMSASSGGTMRAYGAISSSMASVNGDEVSFGVGNLQVTIAGS